MRSLPRLPARLQVSDAAGHGAAPLTDFHVGGPSGCQGSGPGRVGPLTVTAALVGWARTRHRTGPAGTQPSGRRERGKSCMPEHDHPESGPGQACVNHIISRLISSVVAVCHGNSWSGRSGSPSITDCGVASSRGRGLNGRFNMIGVFLINRVGEDCERSPSFHT